MINKILAVLLVRVFILDLKEISFKINFSRIIAEYPIDPRLQYHDAKPNIAQVLIENTCKSAVLQYHYWRLSSQANLNFVYCKLISANDNEGWNE